MIVSRFIQHVKAQNWFAVGLDVLVVIVGIFLGMQVTEWNEERLLAKQEVKNLIALNEDIIRLNEVFKDKILFEDTKAKLADYTYSLLKQDNFLENKQLIAAGMMGLADRRTVNFSSPVYLELLNNGKLILIKSDVLRKEIIAFFSNIDHYQRVLEKNSKHHIDERFIPFVREHITNHYIHDILPPEYILYIDTRFLERTKKLLTTDLMQQAEVLPDLAADDPLWQEFKRQLSWRAMIAIADGDFVANILTRSEALSDYIERYLEELSVAGTHH